MLFLCWKERARDTILNTTASWKAIEPMASYGSTAKGLTLANGWALLQAKKV